MKKQEAENWDDERNKAELDFLRHNCVAHQEIITYDLKIENILHFYSVKST